MKRSATGAYPSNPPPPAYIFTVQLALTDIKEQRTLPLTLHQITQNQNHEPMRGGHEPRSSSSCAACKFLKRKCTSTCIFAPYFRSDEPKKFAKVHKVFGASNVSKILVEVPENQREDTVNSLAYEAEARLRDPVYGCIGAIALLQKKMVELQHDLAIARAKLARYNTPTASTSTNYAAAGCSYTVPFDRVNMVASGEFSGYGGLLDGFGQSSSDFSRFGHVYDFSHVPLPYM